MWTGFLDMHSGGGTKEPPYQHIFIEAERKEAIVIFYNRFKHNPERVTCTCCGEDYSIYSGQSLEELTGYYRGCLWDGFAKCYVEEKRPNYNYITLEEYKNKKDVLIISSGDIKPEERIGDVPVEGYVWL